MRLWLGLSEDDRVEPTTPVMREILSCISSKAALSWRGIASLYWSLASVVLWAETTVNGGGSPAFLVS
jgi:hypothetical protein